MSLPKKFNNQAKGIIDFNPSLRNQRETSVREPEVVPEEVQFGLDIIELIESYLDYSNKKDKLEKEFTLLMRHLEREHEKDMANLKRICTDREKLVEDAKRIIDQGLATSNLEMIDKAVEMYRILISNPIKVR